MASVTFIVDPAIHMWFAIFLTFAAFYFFAQEKLPLEITSVTLLAVLLLFGHIFPLLDENGQNLLNARHLLMGFANPSLIAVIALLVIGQAMVQTAALIPMINRFMRLKRTAAAVGLIVIFLFVMLVSGFMNNTPLVIIAIPVLQSLGAKLGISQSRLMIPLSYVAILGGMTTLIGSSTNMLVSTALSDLGYPEFGFFEFTVPGLMLAGVGAFYVAFILPYLLPSRETMSHDLKDKDREFVAELDILPGSKLIGQPCIDGAFEKLPNVSVRMIQRSGHLILPPFDDYEIEANDILILAASRDTLTDILLAHPGFLLTDREKSEPELPADMPDEEGGKQPVETVDTDPDEMTHVLAEIMITPTSRLIDMSVAQIDFEENYDCIVLGIQRKARVVRRRLHQMRLESGDVLLVAGAQDAVNGLRDNKDMIVLAGSKTDIPVTKRAPHALVIFLLTIGLAATGVLSIAVAAVAGAVGMVVSGCLNVRQMVRAFDRKIYFLVGSALALGTTLQVSGGAVFLADLLLSLPAAQEPIMAAGLLFIIVAIATNLLTNNACAVLFTPIAVNLANEIGADPTVFAITVLFAANCSFASPIGYQTNLLVMGPGHYRFKDFVRGGVPLVLIIWAAYCILARFYFNL